MVDCVFFLDPVRLGGFGQLHRLADVRPQLPFRQPVVDILGAFALLAFTIIHVYMTTTGHTPTSHIKAMITGWDEVEVDDIEAS